MRRTGVGALVALAALAAPLLAACAEDEPPPQAEPTVTESEPAKKPKQRDGKQGAPGDEASDLAEMAEELAEEQGDIPARIEPVLGADISWPQCPKGMGIPEKRTLGMPMPIDDAEFVVIGLTNGPGFTPNPCLADQVDWVEERGLMVSAYAVASYPDQQTREKYGWDGPYDGASKRGRLRNVGYQQARYNVANMVDAGLKTPTVWIDVEPVPSFAWSGDKAANAAVVEGAARAYTEAGFSIGVYSTPYLWDEVVGDLSLGVPEWRAAGQTSQEEATSRCGKDWSIQGGDPVMGQWVADQRDHNITCPGVSADLGQWFHQY